MRINRILHINLGSWPILVTRANSKVSPRSAVHGKVRKTAPLLRETTFISSGEVHVRSTSPNVIPLANCSTVDGLRDQFLKSGGPRLGERVLHEPIPNAHKVDGCDRQHMLEM